MQVVRCEHGVFRPCHAVLPAGTCRAGRAAWRSSGGSLTGGDRSNRQSCRPGWPWWFLRVSLPGGRRFAQEGGHQFPQVRQGCDEQAGHFTHRSMGRPGSRHPLGNVIAHSLRIRHHQLRVTEPGPAPQTGDPLAGKWMETEMHGDLGRARRNVQCGSAWVSSPGSVSPRWPRTCSPASSANSSTTGSSARASDRSCWKRSAPPASATPAIAPPTGSIWARPRAAGNSTPATNTTSPSNTPSSKPSARAGRKPSIGSSAAAPHSPPEYSRSQDNPHLGGNA